MTIIVGRQRIVGDVDGEIACLESLLSDLEHLGNGGVPTAAELAAAPLLDPWCLGTCTLPCLPRNALHCRVGANRGHPILKGRFIRTTDVWALAPELGWARTLSRFYRLGRPMQSGEGT
jgi:hypothetical protein